MIVLVEVVPCNNACRFCSVSDLPMKKTLYSTEELQQIADEWGPLVPFADPTVHSEFPALVSQSIKPEGMTYLCTNGVGIARMPDPFLVFDQLRDWAYEGLSFTLHGLAENHDGYVNRKGAFQDILLATERTAEAGFDIHWNVFLDRRNLNDITMLMALAQTRFGITPYLDIPRHRVHPHMWWYEQFRPTYRDIQTHIPNEWLTERWPQPLETMTEAAWLKVWEKEPDSEDFIHPFEPKNWPPGPSLEYVCISINRDRKVYIDPFYAPPIYLGQLEEGKDALMDKLQQLSEPQPYLDSFPKHQLREEDADLVHPCGYSVRYKAIAAGLDIKDSMNYEGALDFCGHF